MANSHGSNNADIRERLASHFQTTEASAQGPKWDELWQKDFAPWDKGFPSPALVDLLERQDLIKYTPSKGEKRKKALVPGCGKGYDVLLLAAFGYDAYGLEISETAANAAKSHEKDADEKEVYRSRTEDGKGKVTWLGGDFFKDGFLEHVDDEGKFDLIYDYTFFCALPPSLRPQWALRQSQLLAPEGTLICIEFPTYKSLSMAGPPWASPPKAYEAHLPRPGVDIPYDDKGPIEDQLASPQESGLKRVAHYQPERTHEVGMKDGVVLDWIGIWKH